MFRKKKANMCRKQAKKAPAANITYFLKKERMIQRMKPRSRTKDYGK